MWKTPADKGSPRRYENSTFERAIHYVFFKDPRRGGGRKAASKARSSWDRGRPLAPAYQLPKTHIQLESHKSCSKDYPSGRAMLSGLGSAHAKTVKTPLCQNNSCFSSFDLHHVQSILRQGCFHPTEEQRAKCSKNIRKLNQDSSLPLLHSYGLWPFEGMIQRTAQHTQNSLQAPVWIFYKLHALLQSSTSPCPKCI